MCIYLYHLLYHYLTCFYCRMPVSMISGVKTALLSQILLHVFYPASELSFSLCQFSIPENLLLVNP